MKITRNTLVNLKKIITNYGFYLCTLFTIILCFGTGIYLDSVRNDQYSVIRSLTTFDRKFMLNNTDFSSINIAIRGSGSWLTMFIPIISAFAFIPLVCDESESKSIRNSIFRTSKFSFHSSEFLTACISGGFAVMFGYMIFTGLVFILFPNINEYPKEIQDYFNESLSYSYPNITLHFYEKILLIKYAEMFIYGAISAIPAITITCITKNKYIVMCIPFFIKYALNQTCLELSSKAYSDFENIDDELEKFTRIISPDSMLNIIETPEKSQIIIYNLVLVILAFCVYMVVCGRRLDSGE